MAFGRQGEDVELFEVFEKLQGGLEAVLAGGSVPVQLFAAGLGQFAAAQGREGADEVLDPGELAAGEVPSAEGGGLEVLNEEVDRGHGGTAPDSPSQR